MPTALRKPLTDETQKMLDSMDLRRTKQTMVICSTCNTEYGLIYPDTAADEQVAAYVKAVHMGMQNCQSHPPHLNLNF
jgi:hypothetical protein